MRKICIIGGGGSGKSTLAIELQRKLDIPMFHLDALFWQPNWIEMDKIKWTELQNTLCSQPTWILDGNYGGTIDIRLNASDTVIFLDMPTILCLWRVLKRQLKYQGKVRPDMAKDCREKFSLSFIGWVIGYSKTRRPNIMNKLLKLKNKQIFILKSQSEIDDFIFNI